MVSKNSETGNTTVDGGTDNGNGANIRTPVPESNGNENIRTLGGRGNAGASNTSNTGVKQPAGERPDNTGQPDNADGFELVSNEPDQLGQGNQRPSKKPVQTKPAGGKSRPDGHSKPYESVRYDF